MGNERKNKIEYHREGDYYLPNLVLAEQKKIQLNKYGCLRLEYLKKHKKSNNVISVSTPYYNRNIRLARAFGEDYTFDNIKTRIYKPTFFKY